MLPAVVLTEVRFPARAGWRTLAGWSGPDPELPFPVPLQLEMDQGV
jgi:hypothetical protein